MNESTKEVLNYLYIIFEEIEKKSILALDV